MNRQNKDIPHTIDPINIHHFLFKKPTSFTKPMMGSEIISTILAKKMITPTDIIGIPQSSEYRAGKKIITGNVGIAKENAGKQ